MQLRRNGWIAAIVLVSFANANAAKPQAARKPETVRFATEDNLLLTGDLTFPDIDKGKRAPIVILLHMYRSDRSAYTPLRPHLLKKGFIVLAIDLRGHGDSVGPKEMGLAQRVADQDKRLFAVMDRDVAAAYLYLAENHADVIDPSRFALVGASVGCSVALDYAATDRSVDAVVCLTPGTNYLGIDSEDDARKYGERAALFVASDPEREAAETLGKLIETAEVLIAPGKPDDRMAWHGTRMFGEVKGIEDRIATFLAEEVGGPPDAPVAASVNSDIFHAGDSSNIKRISPSNLRWFSSAEEAQARGLRAPRSKGSANDKAEPFPQQP